MTGYTPLFDSLTTGSLCGKWPDIGLWPIILSLSDRNGVVDTTHEYLSAITGLPVAEVHACMKRFREPDPGSRTQDVDGARLVLVDSHRDWGWRIVNHAKYAEKARLIHKNAREVEAGKNAARMGDRRRPPKTADDPLSISSPISISSPVSQSSELGKLKPTDGQTVKSQETGKTDLDNEKIPNSEKTSTTSNTPNLEKGIDKVWLRHVADRLRAAAPAVYLDIHSPLPPRIFKTVAKLHDDFGEDDALAKIVAALAEYSADLKTATSVMELWRVLTGSAPDDDDLSSSINPVKPI